MAKSTKLEAWRVKELLQDIEAKNTPLGEIKLLDICNRNPKVYRLPFNKLYTNSKQGLICRAVQKKFDLRKHLTAENYKKQLFAHNV
eukprot:5627494-Ditylum_brightwellii.AAC.1